MSLYALYPQRGRWFLFFCRMSSTIFPWCTEYDVKDLPDYGGIRDALKFAGDLARACVPQMFCAMSVSFCRVFPRSHLGLSWLSMAFDT